MSPQFSRKQILNTLFMLMQPCNEEFFRTFSFVCIISARLSQESFCVFQYMELSVPECEEEGLLDCDCTQYTGVSGCYRGMDLTCCHSQQKRSFSIEYLNAILRYISELLCHILQKLGGRVREGSINRWKWLFRHLNQI